MVDLSFNGFVSSRYLDVFPRNLWQCMSFPDGRWESAGSQRANRSINHCERGVMILIVSYFYKIDLLMPKKSGKEMASLVASITCWNASSRNSEFPSLILNRQAAICSICDVASGWEGLYV